MQIRETTSSFQLLNIWTRLSYHKLRLLQPHPTKNNIKIEHVASLKSQVSHNIHTAIPKWQTINKRIAAILFPFNMPLFQNKCNELLIRVMIIKSGLKIGKSAMFHSAWPQNNRTMIRRSQVCRIKKVNKHISGKLFRSFAAINLRIVSDCVYFIGIKQFLRD